MISSCEPPDEGSSKTNFYSVCPIYDTTRAINILSGISIVCESGISEQDENQDSSNTITLLEDVRVGQKFAGYVSNNNRVGSFIDIGVGYDGFLHKANFKGHCLYKGTHVEVQITDFDFDKKKIDLELLTVKLNEAQSIDPNSLNVSTKMTCSVCRTDFMSREEQVLHYKLDWHRYNLKQKLQGVESVSAEAFDQLADGGISSLSGTDTETQDDQSGTDTSGSEACSPRRKPKMPFSLPNLPQRERSASVTSTDTECEDDRNNVCQPRILPKLYLRNGSGDIIALYRSVVHGKENVPENSGALLTMVQSLPVQTKWAVILVGGGHFAAAIMNGSQCVAHKTFHRYTVRAKQGSSQGSRDGKQGGHQPKSAGSSLRRYNESALVKDVQELLTLWSEELQSCHRIFYRAAGFNRTFLFSGKPPAFKKTDPRLRTIPFPTRRATFSEVMRIHKLLSSIECFGDHKLYEKFLPQSPRIHLGNKSPKKSPQKQLRKNETKEKSPIKLKLPERLPDEKFDDDSISEDNEPIFEVVEQVFDTSELKEFDFTKKPRKKRAKKKTGGKHQQDPLSSPINGEDYQFRTALYTVCKMGDLDKLMELLCLVDFPNILSHEMMNQNSSETPVLEEPIEIDPETDSQVSPETNCPLSPETPDGIDEVDEDTLTEDIPVRVLNGQATDLDTPKAVPLYSLSLLSEPIGDGGATLLHVAAKEGHQDIVRTLMHHGADPTVRNKQGYTPYTLTSCRETRHEFRRFWADHPDMFDYSKSQIPGPLTAEQEKEHNEKLLERNREKRKLRKDRLKERKIEENSQKVEIEDQKRFLALSDREKRALAAERRLLADAATKNEPLVLSRCFQCGTNITGKVPFEYSNNRFCSPKCVKEHRKTVA